MADNLKLGKLPHKHDERTLKAARYFTSIIPAPPASVDYSSKVVYWQMYANDRLADCTCASAGHMIELWSTMGVAATDPTEAEVIALYNVINGGKDNGAVMLDALNAWRAQGLAGEKPLSFALVDQSNQEHVKQGVNLFAGLNIGLALPQAIQGNMTLWNCVPDNSNPSTTPGTWGGHAVNVTGYDEKTLTIITWGQPVKMTWEFFHAYCDEAWCVMPSELVGEALLGFDIQQLTTDLSQLGIVH